jgi:hypothetical protein
VKFSEDYQPFFNDFLAKISRLQNWQLISTVRNLKHLTILMVSLPELNNG